MSYLDKCRHCGNQTDGEYSSNSAWSDPVQSLIGEMFILLDHKKDNDDHNGHHYTQQTQKQTLAGTAAINLCPTETYKEICLLP